MKNWLIAVAIFISSVCWANNHVAQTEWTLVEKKFLVNSERKSSYTAEKIPVIETDNPFELGKLAALRFLEWVQKNPNGVIALSTATTSEHLIRFLFYYKNNWNNQRVSEELRSFGLISKNFPDTSNLKFVQIDELYPVDQKHAKNSINYIRRNYCELLELKPENVLLMDIANRGILAHKGVNVVFMNGKVNLDRVSMKPTTQLEHWQYKAINEAAEFCKEYEEKIRAWGGIGFYIGNLGFANNVAYNFQDTDFDSVTRLVKLNYVSAAYAAKDLGGIKFSKGKAAITIGLKTITFNPSVVIITLVAGEAKAEMLKNAIEHGLDQKYPATYFQKFKNARFYVTSGSLIALKDRYNETILQRNRTTWNEHDIYNTIIDIAIKRGKNITALTRDDFLAHDLGIVLYPHIAKSFIKTLTSVKTNLINCIEKSLIEQNKQKLIFAHTAPHPNDEFLGYYPVIKRLKDNTHHFIYITSGYNSVTDEYILKVIRRASNYWLDSYQASIFNKPYRALLKKIKFHFYRNNMDKLNNIITLYAIRNIKNAFHIKDLSELKRAIRWLKDEYFLHKNPGDADIPQILNLKGKMRESEAESLWCVEGIPLKNIHHLRSKFYNSNVLTDLPCFEDDVHPLFVLFNSIQPDIITLADDPPGIRPTTNYKSMQVVAKALSDYLKYNEHAKIPRVWGYRNVWFEYSVQEATIMVPVSHKVMSNFNYAFHKVFPTQSSASFPSPFYEGDFASLTIKTQIEQKQQLEALLGSEYFKNHSNQLIRDAVGFVFMKEMNVTEFIKRAKNIRSSTEIDSIF